MANTAIAIYRPRAGREDGLRALLRTHVDQLRALGLATDAPTLLLRSPRDGTYLEIFDWVSEEAVEAAHTHPGVQPIWAAFEEVCEFLRPCDLAEAEAIFPHFERVTEL
jgi:hypothetical protein